VGDIGYRFHIDNIYAGIADAFYIYGLGPIINGFSEVLRVVWIHKHGVNTIPGQGIEEQVVSSAVKGAHSHYFITGAGDIHDRICNRRRTGRQTKCRYTSFQSGQSLFKNIGGWIHNPGVNISRFFQRKKPGRMVRIIKNI
jgi:hypothetical protein